MLRTSRNLGQIAGHIMRMATVAAITLALVVLTACTNQPNDHGSADDSTGTTAGAAATAIGNGGSADGDAAPDNGSNGAGDAANGTISSDEGGALPMATNTVMPPEDATLIGFKYSHMGMYYGPLLSVRQSEEGFDAALTFGEVYWEAIDGKDTIDFLEASEDGTYAFDPYSSHGDPYAGAADGERALWTEDDMAALLDIMLAHNALAWDGYNERWSPSEGLEATDTGDTIDMQILFSDGTVMRVHGVDTQPAGFGDFINDVFDFFEEHGVQVF